MILDKYVEIKVNSRNKSHFQKLGYKNLIIGNTMIITVNHLMKGSRKKIKCECDICGKTTYLTYKDYNKNIKKYNFYTCSDCSKIKNKITNKEKYGVEYGFQNEEIKNKSKNTKLEKYNDEFYLNKEKYKTTMIEKYGVEYPSQNLELFKKQIDTNLRKYGVEYYTQTEEYKIKTKKTNFEKYGVEFCLQNKEIKNKSTITNLKKYGVKNPMQNISIFNKQQTSGFKMKIFKNNLTYRGSYELHFLNNYYDKINIENGKIIKYENNRNYFSDFYLPDYNLIVEIKSSYYYNRYLDLNLKKQKSSLNQGYNFIFIIDKNYEEFENYIKSSFLYSFKNASSDSGSPNPIILSTS